MEEQEIIKFYLENKNKGKYWIARKLNLNKNYVSSLIDRKVPNSCGINIELEKNIIECINKFPYTGTEHKIAKTLNISKHKIRQLILKTSNKKILNHFSSPKSHCKKLTDDDIHQILKGSKLGIGNDLMGLKIGVDGSSVRNIRKKFLTKEEYELYHSKDRYSSPFDRGYKNDRGDSFMSSLEEQVCNFLFELGIKYNTNVQIIEQNKKYCPDIHLIESGAFIEIFGMSDVECYKERMFEKIDYYNNNNIKCLYIFGDSFYCNIDWKDKITQFLEEIKNKKFNFNIKIKCK
jgi:hypothetical protein